MPSISRSGREAGVDTTAVTDATTVATSQHQDIDIVVLGEWYQQCENLARYGNLEVQTYGKSHLVSHLG